MDIDIGSGKIISILSRREEDQDKVVSEVRKIIRDCANAIKLVHSGNIKEAEKLVASVDKQVAALPKTGHTMRNLSGLYVEIVEVKVLLSAIKREKIPKFDGLGVEIEDYLNGLCDCIGELRREMLECLKAGKGKDASYYFDVMSAIYEAMVPIRFSSSILPNFRRKQDVARMQVESARSELLRHMGK